MKFKTKVVTIDGEKFKIQEINARQRKELFKLYQDDNSDALDSQAHAIKMGCEKFRDSSIDEIFEMPGTVFANLADEVMKLSGLGDDDEKDAVKNS